MPTLKTLLEGYPVVSITGNRDTAVNCLITDSRRVVPGALFFAVGGLRTDGNYYIEEAIDRGAVAVISEKKLNLPQVVCVQVEDIRAAVAHVARLYYGRADEQMGLIGITGTNGKTTVSMLLQEMLREKNQPCGLIGTVRYDLGRRSLPAYKTTPEAVDIHAMLRQMVDEGCRHVAMEVSSHAIAQKRVQGLKVKTAVFLNLTRDHIDYHGDMETYFGCKAALFNGGVGQLPKNAVVNTDSDAGKDLAKRIPSPVHLITFGLNEEATVRARDVVSHPDSSDFRLIWPEGEASVHMPLPGHYNVSNALAALAVAYAEGLDLTRCLQRLSAFAGVPGRMEKVDLGQPFQVLVDYAHTDDALHNALSMLRPITPGRLLVVFGCGGNRDREKRPLMTSAVQRWADYAWATSDNPRKESVDAIFKDMQPGVSKAEAITFVPDRRRAISLALDEAKPGDCVLIAGKGHEAYQEFADTVIPFDDRQVARDLLSLKQFRAP
jgi:UDP-N-acetylmuramoyl-L-alanyl-D-glutamate--2,6-diaminopimelate ligase